TIPYHRAPHEIRSFVASLAQAKGVGAELHDATAILTLLGTRGVKPAWNDRRKSQGHVGIPLLSATVVDAIPMIARLLTELGVDLAWVDQKDQGIMAMAAATSVAGTFYVEDAATGVDRLERRIIPAQDFVAENGVHTVFGAGVTYVDGMLATLIVFAKEYV